MIMILQLCIVSLLLPIISSGIPPHEFVEQLNEKRRELAQKNDLGNMRELSWDKDLAVSVVDSWNNKTLRDKKNVDSAIIDSYEAIILALNDTVGKDRQNLIDLTATYILHFLGPLHDKIGCSEVAHENAYLIFCYLSPKSPLKEMFDKFGAPGTRCSDGYVGVDGLCRFVPTITRAPEPTTEKETVQIVQQTTKTLDIDHQISDSTTHETSADDAQSSGGFHFFIDLFVFFMFTSFVLYQ